jgi:hypothetical protein
MELLVLIDKLDDVMHKARPVPLTDQVRVDKEQIYDILDQLRAAIPESLKEAEYVERAPGGIDRQALTDAIRECIPEIAAAVVAATSSLSGPSASPPGGPF